MRLWLNGSFTHVFTTALPGRNTNAQGVGGAGGIDFGFGPARIGIGAGHRAMDGTFGAGTKLKAKATSVGGYGAVALPAGLYLEAAGSRTVDLKFDAIVRAAAYGQTACANTKGRVYAGTGEFRSAPLRRGRSGRSTMSTRGSPASTRAARRWPMRASAASHTSACATPGGAEIRGTLSPYVRSNVRAGFGVEDERGARTATATLISAQHSLATQTVALPSTERNRLFAGGSIDGSMGPIGYGVTGVGRFDRGPDDARMSLTVFTRF